jgi:hypothetical protein
MSRLLGNGAAGLTGIFHGLPPFRRWQKVSQHLSGYSIVKQISTNGGKSRFLCFIPFPIPFEMTESCTPLFPPFPLDQNKIHRKMVVTNPLFQAAPVSSKLPSVKQFLHERPVSSDVPSIFVPYLCHPKKV